MNDKPTLTELYAMMKEAESEHSKIRADIVKKMKLTKQEQGRGFQTKIIEMVPKLDNKDGYAILAASFNGKTVDPEILKAVDELTKDQNDNK